MRHMKMVQGALDISSVYSYLGALTAKTTIVEVMLLSKPQLIHNSTQPQSNITLVGLDMKMTFQTTPQPHPTHSMLAISQLLLT